MAQHSTPSRGTPTDVTPAPRGPAARARGLARGRHDGDGYRERLTVPWWMWPVSLALAALLAAEVFLGAPTALIWVPYAVLLPGTALALLLLGRIVVRVADGELYVDDAHLPVSYITEVNVLDANARRMVLGPLAERYAFVIQRPWVRDAVRIVLDDPDDPTPYWVVSSRHPANLASAIVAAREASGSDAGSAAS